MIRMTTVETDAELSPRFRRFNLQIDHCFAGGCGSAQ
jgi:hypothetical protein